MSGMELAAIFSASGSALSGLGKLQAGFQEEKAMTYNARLATAEGKYEAAASEEKTEQAIGAARATYGASNISTSSGSPLLALSEMAAEGEMERLNILRAAKAKHEMYKFYGKQARIGGYLGMSGSFFQGAANASGQLAK